jgi:hypothetical protein
MSIFVAFQTLDTRSCFEMNSRTEVECNECCCGAALGNDLLRFTLECVIKFLSFTSTRLHFVGVAQML